MTTAETSPISDSEKSRLVDHLREKVVAGLSGRDGADLVDVVPSRAVFAGLLHPARDLAAPTSVNEVSTAPGQDVSIGVDFRVLPDPGDSTVRLTLAPRWSHYYAVFPTYSQVLAANPAPTEKTAQPAAELRSDNPSVVGPPLDAPTEGEDSERNEDQAEAGVASSEDTVPEAETGGGRVVLPRVFRRINARPNPITVSISRVSGTVVAKAGEAEIGFALGEIRDAIAKDPECWRHLGDPSSGERSLGYRGVLASETAFLQALGGVQGDRIAVPEWSASLQVESQPDATVSGALRVKILLVNQTKRTEGGDAGLREDVLFDAGLDVTIESGQLAPFEFLLAPSDYKNTPTMPARGINCSVVRRLTPHVCLSTDTLPVFQQPLFRTRNQLQIVFSQLDTPEYLAVLRNIVVEMNAYLARWDTFLQDEAVRTFTDDERRACLADREAFAAETAQFELGIECLKDNALLARAFRLMNRVFGRLGAASGGRVTAWRLFQIGFIVSQLPALAVREMAPERDDDLSRRLNEVFPEVGVLWFPTGGGKTEAYLGLIATALLFDRLRGKKRGVSAWMRFPLRMLSLQQLERLARVVAALNVLREEEKDVAAGDVFAIGYFVGDDVTPNAISDDEMTRYATRDIDRQARKVLRKCPFCGALLRVEMNKQKWRLLHQCGNAECFSNKSPSMGEHRGSIPLFITDNEIYRYIPSILVGTVDKLAIISRSRYFSHILRGPLQRCSVHGYTSYDDCIERWNAGCQPGKRGLTQVEPERDPVPALLVQDELHLLRSELGVFNGHYEGLLRHLGSRISRPPKVLAATATIEAYDQHAFHVYLSRSRRFPVPSFEKGESFYATSEPLTIRRTFVGVRNHTRGIEDSVLRALTLYWLEIRRLEQAPERVAEILGRPDLPREQILAVLRLYDLSVVYVNRKATGGSILTRVGRINNVLQNNASEPVEAKLLTGDAVDDVGVTLERIDKELEATTDRRLNVLIATSLISHGVDLERINFMVMAGVPSRYAEYLQSTSRAARSHPGLVFVCFKGSDPREASQCDFFYPMHENIDRLIEAVAVNRYSSFAPRKTVPGLLAGVLLCDATPRLFGKSITKPLDHLPTLQVALGYKPQAKSGTRNNCVTADELRAAIHQIIGVDRVYPPASSAEVANARRVIDDALDDQLGLIARSLESQLKNAIRPLLSFRDVDEGIDFGSLDSASYVTRLRPR